jgi:myo-inositol 2-dehydrogenase / D-chiro-inositol 1-dehydrogenase
VRDRPFGILCVTGDQTHQENYAVAFAADSRARIVAVTDELEVDARRRELNERLAAGLRVPYIADLDEALARPEVDVCSVCAPPERRGRIAIRCARAGKHLYLDKSLAPSLEEAHALAAAVRAAGVRSHMFSMITQPWARAARDLIANGRIGRLVGIHADFLFGKGIPGTAALGSRRREEFPPQRHQLVEAKREFDNVGVYPITLARWLSGVKFRTVHCVTGNYFFGHYQKHNVEDFGLLTGTLEDGTSVTISAGRFGWTSHPAGGVTRMLLAGTERAVLVDANRPRLEVYCDESPWVPPTPDPEDPMAFWQSTIDRSRMRPKRTWIPALPPARSDASYFLDCLEQGRESELAVAEAAHAAEVLVAAYASAARRQVVTLPFRG